MRRGIVFVVSVAFALVCVGLTTLSAEGQLYPPPPIGGSGNSGTGNNNTNTNTFGSTGSQSASAADDGPACDLDTCLRFSGEVDGKFVSGRVEELGDVRVASLSGCCDALAKVDIYMETTRVYLGTVYAAEDGSYSAQFTLPSSIKAGTHTIIADIEGCGELKRTVQVLGSGASVLGTTVRNTAGASGTGGLTASGGILPRTGRDLLLWLVWAIVLIAFGIILVVAAWRWSQRYDRFRKLGRRVERARGGVPALPPPQVPFVDTSRFVPYGSRTGSRAGRSNVGRPRRTSPPVGRTGSNTTEWAAEPKNDSKS
jgi:hypothetical protein